jgi:hypothetical protein
MVGLFMIPPSAQHYLTLANGRNRNSRLSPPSHGDKTCIPALVLARPPPVGLSSTSPHVPAPLQ